MARYTLRRFLQGVVTMWLVMTAVFVVLRLASDLSEAILPEDATVEQVVVICIQLGGWSLLPCGHHVARHGDSLTILNQVFNRTYRRAIFLEGVRNGWASEAIRDPFQEDKKLRFSS